MKALLAFLLTATAITSGNVVKSSGENFELLILHNNDMHARFEQTSQLSGACTTADREAGKCYGGFARVAHVVKEARRAAQTGEGPPVLYLNAGDTYTGTAWFTIYKWKIAAEFINALQPDAVSLGNHEFDLGVSGLTPFIKNLKSPVVAANLDLSKVPELEAEQNLVNSVIFNINGTKIAVVGYLTPETKTIAKKNDVEYIEEVTAVRAEIANLKKQGIKIFIALGHSGHSKDLDVAKNVNDIDVVIGGHSNTFLWNGTAPDVEEPQGPYPVIVKQKLGRLVPTAQAYAFTKYLGKLHIVFDSNGEVLNAYGNPILLNNMIPEEPNVLKMVSQYHEKFIGITENIIGTTAVNLDGQTCRLRECNFGNLIADAMIYKYASEYKGYGWTDTPIAVINGGNIRISIESADYPINITQADLIQVLPFDGYTVRVLINGSDLKKMLENSVSNYDTLNPPGGFLQVSGLKVEYDIGQPSGKRVIKVHVRCGKCLTQEYDDLEQTKMYALLLPQFLAHGGDGYTVFIDKELTLVNFLTLDSTAEYISLHSPVNSTVEGRIIINNINKS